MLIYLPRDHLTVAWVRNFLYMSHNCQATGSLLDVKRVISLLSVGMQKQNVHCADI